MPDQNFGKPLHRCECPVCTLEPNSRTSQQHQAINRLLPTLDERSRRLFAGLLAQQEGRGGASRLARITGLSRTTVLRGKRELLQIQAGDSARIRQAGGGRKPVEKKGA